MWRRFLDQKGVSLMELMAVLTLLGIMSVYAVPIILDTNLATLDGACKKLEADVRYAQSLATTTGTDHGVRTVASDDGTIVTYEIYNDDTDAVVESPYDHLDMTENLSTEGYQGISFSGADDVVFNQVGTPTYDVGDGTMTLETTDGDSKDVVISTTGLIGVQ